ncbi:IAA-amino acid hydrolase ILR1-like 4 isoform X2 [Mangifera indica]|uniref:IAA-amino acid hydrolase ILR1-like 4 isoform X2 n=1 Tax=Mangifera indica TaxID=29780 RepID=UPI001CFAC2A9|nr:IAA-amino acid hydrolase ILR1-like 4 isoform X2 [Mangifera indica]
MLGIMQPLTGSEDFAFYQEVIPGNFFFLGMRNETSGKLESPPPPYLTVIEDALPYGSALHASLALSFLQSQVWPSGLSGIFSRLI